MSFIDWMIVIIPLAFVMGMGVYSRKYIKSVADFLVAGRMCGRYVISIGDVANALAIITLVAYVETQYKTGFALGFWGNISMPLGIILGLTGFCTYRFRETKAMSLGQFLEMRYNRKLRIFASGLRSLSEMLANMIMPAVAARFFIYFLDLPRSFNLFGLECPTFMVIVTIVLVMAISLICMGGTLALVITDAIQGMFCYPLLVVFVIFILCNFSWDEEIIPVMMDRTQGESFLNPYDVENLRDFNVVMLIVGFVSTVLHRASWIGAGTSSAAKSAHEQKMAGLLGTWRGVLGTIMYLLIAIVIIVLLNHKDFASQARDIRVDLTSHVAEEVVVDPAFRAKMVADLKAIPPQEHIIGQDAPLSDKQNLDTIYLTTAHENLKQLENGNGLFQEFRTLYYQMMLAVTTRQLFPPIMVGMFCLLLILMMLSTDDTRIYSASLTITQDVVMPFCKKPLTPRQHIFAIRAVSVGVGVVFFFGSLFMSQLDYINLYSTIMCSIWLGGCGPVMIFGLYSRFGTTAGAFASLLSGMFFALGGVLIQRNWANAIYPFLDEHGWVPAVDSVLQAISRPLNPWVEWVMNPIKCPVNSYEIYFLTMMATLIIYCVVSKLTCKEPFNMDRMLHRGKYALGETKEIKVKWTPRNILSNIIGITPEYSKGDKIIAWGIFFYSFVYSFGCAFLGVLIWNTFSPWPIEWWGKYFFIINLAVPGLVAAFSTVWFGVGGVIDLCRLFRDLENRTDINDLDNGMVEGNMSLADKAQLEALDTTKAESNQPANEN